MDRSEVKMFVRDDGFLDEFALMSSEKKVAPLHYVLFRSHAAHLGHEANTEVLVEVLIFHEVNLSDHRMACWREATMWTGYAAWCFRFICSVGGLDTSLFFVGCCSGIRVIECCRQQLFYLPLLLGTGGLSSIDMRRCRFVPTCVR